jgi:hypothetical protein
MIPRIGLLGVVALAVPATLAAQTRIGSYRGFAPGASYREFTERARALAQENDPLVCNTSRRTAQLMECGASIRDPQDSAAFYVSAYVLEGRVALVSFGDSGGVPLVDRTLRDLTARFGPGRQTGHSTLEWVDGQNVARLNWRGRGAARWIYITLWDKSVMDRISKYVTRKN